MTAPVGVTLAQVGNSYPEPDFDSGQMTTIAASAFSSESSSLDLSHGYENATRSTPQNILAPASFSSLSSVHTTLVPARV